MGTPKVKTRHRAATEEKLLTAVETLLTQEGFAALGVNAIAREAGADKVLIYRYFGGLPQLLRAFAESDAFWPDVDEVLGVGATSLAAMPTAERWATGLVRYARALRRRPIVREVLAWEQVEKNELTEILRARREEWFETVLARLPNDDDYIDAQTIPTVLLIATAIHYLIARSRLHGDFNGLKIDREEAWADVEQVVHTLCSRTLLRKGEVR